MENLGTKAVRGATITLASQGAKFALSLGITMILARLLTPRDYGLFAMAALFTGLVAIFRDGGLSIATVQRANITGSQVSTLFWFNLALGIALALFMVAISPAVGWFYHEQALVRISLALAIPFVFNGLGAQPQALLQRALRSKLRASWCLPRRASRRRGREWATGRWSSGLSARRLRPASFRWSSADGGPARR